MDSKDRRDTGVLNRHTVTCVYEKPLDEKMNGSSARVSMSICVCQRRTHVRVLSIYKYKRVLMPI